MKAMEKLMSLKAQRAAMVIGLAILMYIIINSTINFWGKNNLATPKTISDNQKADSLLNEKNNNTNLKYNNNEQKHLFYFDPNRASEMELHQLGFTDYNIKTITNYRLKGGRFYEQDDLKKIWGLRPELVQELLPYVRIEGMQKKYQPKVYSTEKFNPNSNKNYDKIVENNYSSLSEHNKTNHSNDYPIVKQQQQKPNIIEINSADTSQFQSLYGIGPALARRIVLYREKLGGFSNINQIREVYGIADTTYDKFSDKLTLKSTPYKKININTATVDELKQHPYLRNPLAKVIIAYRDMHGSFKNLDDLKKVHLVTDDILIKLEPYIQF